MNIIISILEFIVLVTSIGLFFAKREKTSPDGEWNTNWGVAILVATILMIGMNIKFICSGIYCFFTCAVDDTPGSESAKRAVAIYRRVKEGKKAELGMFGYGNVDLKHLNQDLEEERLFLGAETPEEIETIAKRATKTELDQRLRDRQEATKQLVGERTGEYQKVVAGRPKDPRIPQGPSAPVAAEKPGFGQFLEKAYKNELGAQATRAKYTAQKEAEAKKAKEEAEMKAALKAAAPTSSARRGLSSSIESASSSVSSEAPVKLKRD